MLSPHFSRAEFRCNCNSCGQDTVDAELIMLCEAVRDFVKKPVRVLSGNRCPAYNRRIGGARHSQHLYSRAADLSVMHPREVYDYLVAKFPNKYGFGVYPTFIHVDSRQNAARW